MVKKVTYTLDDATVRRVESASERLRVPKSQVIRDAVADFHDSLGRLSEPSGSASYACFETSSHQFRSVHLLRWNKSLPRYDLPAGLAVAEEPAEALVDHPTAIARDAALWTLNRDDFRDIAYTGR